MLLITVRCHQPASGRKRLWGELLHLSHRGVVWDVGRSAEIASGRKRLWGKLLHLSHRGLVQDVGRSAEITQGLPSLPISGSSK